VVEWWSGGVVAVGVVEWWLLEWWTLPICGPKWSISSPFSISNPEDRVLFMERTFMCLVSFRANVYFRLTPGQPWAKLFRPLRATEWKCPRPRPE
jgi:hypothetical protein